MNFFDYVALICQGWKPAPPTDKPWSSTRQALEQLADTYNASADPTRGQAILCYIQQIDEMEKANERPVE